MPFTFNGLGTKLYGARDFRPDGSHITTEWFVIAYVPIVSMKSMRIRPAVGGKYYGLYNSSTYYILEKTSLNSRQLLCVYGWFAAFLAAVAYAFPFTVWWQCVPGVLLLPVPWLLRRRAIERMAAEAERRKMGLSATTTD
jgi:hypothetical protein